MTNQLARSTIQGALTVAKPNVSIPTTRVVAPTERVPARGTLPDGDGVPMETGRHYWQMTLLLESIEPWLRRRYAETGKGGFVAGDMFVYFSPDEARDRDFCGPDVFVVADTPMKERKCWVTWKEGKGPSIVIELLSDSTKRYDKTEKKTLYQDQLRVEEYYWFDPFDPDDFAGFRLCKETYKQLVLDEHGRIASECLDLRLGPWQGTYHNIDATWLRWYTAAGDLVLTEGEQAAQRADQEAQRAEAFARKLRELGVDPASIA